MLIDLVTSYLPLPVYFQVLYAEKQGAVPLEDLLQKENKIVPTKSVRLAFVTAFYLTRQILQRMTASNKKYSELIVENCSEVVSM